MRAFLRRNVSVVIVAVITAALTGTPPVVAHVTKKLNHLTKHLDPRYVNVGENVPWGTVSGIPAGFADGVDNTGGTANDLDCAGCVGESELGFNPATQGELDAHKTSSDHDGRYFTESELQTPGTINTVGNPVDWTKLKNVPLGFADGVDDTGSGTATDVACSGCVDTADLAPNAVTSAKILDNEVTTDDIANATITVADLAFDPATQAELDALGADDGAINQAGDPVHWTKLKGVPGGFADGLDDTGSSLPVFTATVADPTGGSFGSGTIGSDGLGLFVQQSFASGSGTPTIVHCQNVACTSSTLEPLPGFGGGSITIGSDGFGLVVHGNSSFQPVVTHCQDLACSTHQTSPAFESVSVSSTAITLGVDGKGLIAYRKDGDLWTAHCADAPCSSATPAPTSIDAGPANVGNEISIAVGTDGLALISYDDNSSSDLKVAHCSDLECDTATVVAVDTTGSVGRFSSITIGSDGLGLISYDKGGDLGVAHCSDVACSAVTTNPFDPAGQVGWYTSVAVGADGLGVIGYYDVTNADLKVLHCSNVTCSSGTVTAADTGGNVGAFASLTVGMDGMPLIGYYDNTNDDMKVMHCSNPFCVPYFRRR
jgi:hypothetical protein